MKVFAAIFLFIGSVAAASAQNQRSMAAEQTAATAAAPDSGPADGASGESLMGNRRPLYRLHTSDVLEISFGLAPEFNQTVYVRPDGFISLKAAGELHAEGRTVSELRESVRSAYAATLHEPEIGIVLKDFAKPYFIVTGEVARPGKYELRSDATITEALAVAGGFTGKAKSSQVVLFRPVAGERIEARLINMKQMLSSRNLAEDIHPWHRGRAVRASNYDLEDPAIFTGVQSEYLCESGSVLGN